MAKTCTILMKMLLVVIKHVKKMNDTPLYVNVSNLFAEFSIVFSSCLRFHLFYTKRRRWVSNEKRTSGKETHSYIHISCECVCACVCLFGCTAICIGFGVNVLSWCAFSLISFAWFSRMLKLTRIVHITRAHMYECLSFSLCPSVSTQISLCSMGQIILCTLYIHMNNFL